MVEDLPADAVQAGDVRDGNAPGELAGYCLHALTAAGDLPSEAAVHRLVVLTLTGVRPGGVHASDGPRRTDATVHAPHHPGHRSGHGGHAARS